MLQFIAFSCCMLSQEYNEFYFPYQWTFYIVSYIFLLNSISVKSSTYLYTGVLFMFYIYISFQLGKKERKREKRKGSQLSEEAESQLTRDGNTHWSRVPLHPSSLSRPYFKALLLTCMIQSKVSKNKRTMNDKSITLQAGSTDIVYF